MTAADRTLPDPTTEPTISVGRAAKVLGVGKDAVYAAAERGDLPSIKVGRRVVLPTRKFLAATGLLDDTRSDGAASRAA